MPKRICVLFFIALLAFALLSCRLSLLATNSAYANAATAQSAYYLDFESGRGNFYDCQFRQLTGVTNSSYALVAPSTESYRALFDIVPEEDRAFLYENIQKSAPFLMSLPVGTITDCPTFLRANRYMTAPFAPQLLGYCNSAGQGESGLERACDTLLQNGSTKEQLACVVDARGNLIRGETPRLVTETGTGAGVMLTLDAALQRLCEAAARETMDKGAVVVMETATGRVRASVSLPDYNPSDVVKSLSAVDSPFIDRCISSYNVGSVFKPLLAAIALESGYDTKALYECSGAITVGDHVYRCAYGRGHEEVDLEKALAQSCNCYFVEMGLALGGEKLVRAMQEVGFGESTVLAGALRTARGNIPTVGELQNLGALASISFGQGTLTASPVQIAAFFNAIANGGVYLSPTFVEGYVDEYKMEVAKSLYAPVTRRCMQPETAELLRSMLVNVVENGLGIDAKPKRGSAGGKTGTAQTGRYTENGEEIMDAWFAGFYPADKPEYTIAVLLDSGTHNSDDACAVFARVADALAYFTQADLTKIPLDITPDGAQGDVTGIVQGNTPDAALSGGPSDAPSSVQNNAQAEADEKPQVSTAQSAPPTSKTPQQP